MKVLRRRRFLLPLLVVALGAVLRLYALGAESLWTDELITVNFVMGMTAPELLVRIPQTQPHLPLYYVLLDLWIGLAGSSTTAMRLLSALFGIGSVGAFYALGRHLVDQEVGLVASLLLALSSFHVYYAQEVRMYSLLTFLTITSFYALVRFRESPTRRTGVAYLLLAVAVASTHFFGIFVVAAQMTYLAVRLDSLADDRLLGLPVRRLQQGYATAALVSPFVIIGVVSLLDHVPRYHYIPYPSLWGVVTTITEYLGYPEGTEPFAIVGLFCLFVGTATLAFVRFDAADRQSVVSSLRSPKFGIGDDEDRDALTLAALWFAVPFGGPLVLSYLVTPLFWPRYTIAASTGLLLLVAMGVRNLPRGQLRVAVAILLAVSLVPSTALYHTQTDKEQWRAVGTTIEQDAEPGDYVLVVDRITARGVRYYSDRSDITIRGVAVEGSGTGRDPAPTSKFENSTDSRDRIWVVFSHAPDSERRRVLNVVNDSRTMVRHEQYEKVELYLFVSEGNQSSSRATVPDAPRATNRPTQASRQRQGFAAPL